MFLRPKISLFDEICISILGEEPFTKNIPGQVKRAMSPLIGVRVPGPTHPTRPLWSNPSRRPWFSSKCHPFQVVLQTFSQIFTPNSKKNSLISVRIKSSLIDWGEIFKKQFFSVKSNFRASFESLAKNKWSSREKAQFHESWCAPTHVTSLCAQDRTIWLVLSSHVRVKWIFEPRKSWRYRF